MAEKTFRAIAFLIFMRACLLGMALSSASSAYAQVSISNDGVIFPDDTEQNSAVVVPMNCPHGDSIVWDTNADSWVCATDLSAPPTFTIGDIGPAGGKVFYITDGGSHGLEAAPSDQGQALWGCMGVSISGVSTTLGSGASNTARILASCAEEQIAALIADSYELNGYDDWFLPSKDELQELYNQRIFVGGFLEPGYWSSSELESDPANRAYYHGWNSTFEDFMWHVEKDPGTLESPAVRPIRTF